MAKISAETIEPIIFKLAMTSTKHADIIAEYFEKHWFEDTVIGEILHDLVKDIYCKRGFLPKQKTVELYTEKRYTKESALVTKISSIYDIDISQYDASILDEEFISYIKNIGLYYTLMGSIDEIEDTKTVSCIEALSKLSSMTFIQDNGMNYLEDIEQHIEYLQNPESRLSTGWDFLDKKLNGGYHKSGKCLCIYVAKPGMGKSLVLSNTAANYLKMGKFVIVFSLELSQEEYAKRIDGNLTGMTVNELNVRINEFKDKIYKFKECNTDGILVIKEFAPDTVSCNNLSTIIDRLRKKYNREPDAILIDYTALLLPNEYSKTDNSYAKVGKVTKDMRGLSYKYPCPVISAAQLNREQNDSNDIEMSGIAESMGIAHNADYIAALYQNDGDRQQGIINFKIIKNRLSGYLGSIAFDINYRNLIISDAGSEGEIESDEEIKKLTSQIDNTDVETLEGVL